jgi:hypothetical protein
MIPPIILDLLVTLFKLWDAHRSTSEEATIAALEEGAEKLADELARRKFGPRP